MSPVENAGDALLPAWSLDAEAREDIAISPQWPHPVTREWAWGGSRGEGVRVCLLDSGIDSDHPDVVPVAESLVVEASGSGAASVRRDELGDASGHGTACAGVLRRIAPACELTSLRVLGKGAAGTGADLIAGLAWAAEEEFDLINLSLSTTRRRFAELLHEIADPSIWLDLPPATGGV